MRTCNKNKFRIGFIDTGLRNVLVAFARGTARPSSRIKKGIEDVDVYETDAKLICFVVEGVRGAPTRAGH